MHDKREFIDWLLPRAIGILFIAVVLSASFACQAQLWKECRAAGHSKLYCWFTVTRR